jgi:integrase
MKQTDVPQALDINEASSRVSPASERPATSQKLVEIFSRPQAQRGRNPVALKSKVSLLSQLLDKPGDQITVQDLYDIMPRLRFLLKARRLTENSVRTYIQEMSLMLRLASETENVTPIFIPAAWETVMQRCVGKRCDKIARYCIALRARPGQVAEDDILSWVTYRVQHGGALSGAENKARLFRRILASCGNMNIALASVKPNYSIPLEECPELLKTEITTIIKWKTDQFASGRPQRERIRQSSAINLERVFRGLYGFTQNVANMPGIISMSDLITHEVLERYVEWAINERGMSGNSVQRYFFGIKAALRHPKYRNLCGPWLKELSDGIPTEEDSDVRQRQLAKQIPYEIVETIPEQIHRERKAAERKGEKEFTLVLRNELIMRWLLTLAWRQHNIRGCRIEGNRPNLFLAKLDPLAPVTKPAWVSEALKADPDIKLWQIRFSTQETKAGNEVHALLPRPLIVPLEEYLAHRKHLVGDSEVDTLFVNDAGRKMDSASIVHLVAELTLRYVNKSITPHTFRHIVAYGWLKDHPEEYLTLSKLLFHKNLNTTLRCYASRFNVSDGVCGMERWLEERSKKVA